MLAENCARLDIPLIHISTDYVYDGGKKSPYVETDPTSPLGMYGHSKLEGDRDVIAANSQHIILRTAWVYSPFGHNFVKTMLRLGQTRDELSVVDDQQGSPSYAPHIAASIMQLWGIYHMAGGGDTTWCRFAREIFAQSRRLGGPSAKVSPISTAQYATPAKCPANSSLDCSKLNETFGISLPDWHKGTAECVERLLEEERS